MADETTNKMPNDQPAEMREKIERLSAENLLLRQRIELELAWREERDKQVQQFREHRRDVEREIDKRLVGLSLVGFLVIGLGWWSVSLPIRRSVQNRLDKEFASQNIKKLISAAAWRAARSQTNQMMETTLKPAVNKAMGQIQEQKSTVMMFAERVRRESKHSMGRFQGEIALDRKEEQRSLQDLRNKYTNEIAQLRSLVEFQEKLKQLEMLKDEAINGDFDAFEKLVSYRSSDNSLDTDAQTAVIQVKEAYMFAVRTRPVSIWVRRPNSTTRLTDEQISSGDLIKDFLFSKRNWIARTKAARLLGSKREMGVPEALLKAMQHDPNLWVRRAALLSFEKLTGYRENDVFDFIGADQWWKRNKANYLKTIRR